MLFTTCAAYQTPSISTLDIAYMEEEIVTYARYAQVLLIRNGDIIILPLTILSSVLSRHLARSQSILNFLISFYILLSSLFLAYTKQTQLSFPPEIIPKIVRADSSPSVSIANRRIQFPCGRCEGSFAVCTISGGQ